jgi:hypothetical protein
MAERYIKLAKDYSISAPITLARGMLFLESVILEKHIPVPRLQKDCSMPAYQY